MEYRDENGELHREGGPAVELTHYKEWVWHGKLHRVGGPAVECADGRREWHTRGKMNRLDGPASERPGFSEYWCIKDEYYDLPEYCTTVWNLITTKKASAPSWRYLYNNMDTRA